MMQAKRLAVEFALGQVLQTVRASSSRSLARGPQGKHGLCRQGREG